MVTTLVRPLGSLVLLAATGVAGVEKGHSQDRLVTAGLEVQGYPAGVIVTGRGVFGASSKAGISVYAGYNLTDRGDFGEHEDEDGGGPGVGVAFWRAFGPSSSGWTVGTRLDLWFLDIDWRDDGGSRMGTTDVTVLQPTARLGYQWRFAADRLRLDATAALGAEVNIHTLGEDVGEGLIVLGGLGLAYRF